MKYLFATIALIAAISLTGCCYKKSEKIIITPEAQKNHLQRNHLFGQVESVSTTSYLITPHDISSPEKKGVTSAQFYSSDGYLTKSLTLYNEDTLTVRIIHYLEPTKEDYWEEVDLLRNYRSKCLYKYDVNGFKQREEYYFGDSLLYATQYKLDGTGRAIEMARTYEGYTVTNNIFYNTHGLVEKMEERDPEGKVYKYITIEYDNHGNEVNRRAFKRENDMIEYTYTVYNEQGHLLKVIFEDCINSIREERVYEDHDPFGNWRTEHVSKNGEYLIMRKRIITYY